MSDFSSTILVLGASSDIGGEIIRSIDDGSSLIFAHYNRNREKIERLQGEVRSRIVPIFADLSREGDIASMIGEIQNFCTCPDQIVHLPAPKITNTRFKDSSWNDFQNEMNIQLRSIVVVLREFLPLMAKKRSGKIVFVLSSCCVGVPPKALASYTTTKYALLGLMKSLASEYADKKITVNAVSPSMTETSFLSEIPEKLVELTGAGHPQKRNAVPGDIAPLVKFLLSKESDYITGVNVPVAGGIAF